MMLFRAHSDVMVFSAMKVHFYDSEYFRSQIPQAQRSSLVHTHILRKQHKAGVMTVLNIFFSPEIKTLVIL